MVDTRTPVHEQNDTDRLGPKMATVTFQCGHCSYKTPAIPTVEGQHSYLGTQPGDVGAFCDMLDIVTGVTHWENGVRWGWTHVGCKEEE